MKTHHPLFNLNIPVWLVFISLFLSVGQVTAANRIFPLYLKNGLDHDVTFKIEMGSCYQGTGHYQPHKILHGPINPGKRVKLDIARVQGNGCDGKQGAFNVTTTDPRYRGSKQGFSFDNAGNLGLRYVPDSFSGHLSPKSTRDESYTWTILKPIPTVEPGNNRLIRIQNGTSGEYLTQAYSGQRDDKRNVTVWPLPDAENNGFRWLMQKADGGYWHIINLASSLALTWDGSGKQNVSDWGITSSNNPNQLWRFERRNNRFMIINKATNQGLNQAYGGIHPDKKNVTVWPGQTFDVDGGSWRLEDGGYADLLKLTVQTVKAIKTSTGQDIGTEILFGAIEAAATGGSSAAKKVGTKAIKITAREVIKEAGKEAGKSALEAGARELSGANAHEDALKDNLRNQDNAAGTVSDIGLGAMDAFEEATSLQNAFNTIYGESPDDLNIKVNNVSIWPNGGRDSRKIKSQQTLPVNTQFIFERSRGLAIQLVEYDYGSDDDSLGWIGFTEKELTQTRLYEEVLVRSDSEGSLYALTFTLGPVGMDAAEVKNFEGQQLAKKQAQQRQWEQEDRQVAANIAEADRKWALLGTIPASAKMRVMGDENGTSRIPLNRHADRQEGIFISPALYLEVTFKNDGRSGPFYQDEAPDNVIFDDVSGDPDDIIKLVNTPNAKGAETPGQVTATGNGVGTAYINVSFRNAPGVTASVAVEVVDTGPKPLAVNPRAGFLNEWAAQQRGANSFPYKNDIFDISQIYSRCPAGCEMVSADEDILIVMGLPDYAQTDVSMADVDERVKLIFQAGYCAGDGKRENATMRFAVGDKYGARVANTTFTPVNCQAAQAPPAQAAPAAASTNASAQLFNRLAQESRAEIALPLSVDIFEMREIYSICPAGCELQADQPGVFVKMILPAYGRDDVPADEVGGRVAQLLAATYCAGEVKKANGIMWIIVDDMHGVRTSEMIFSPGDCPAGSETIAQTPNVVSPQNQVHHTAQLFNRLATGSRAEINLPFTADIFQMTRIYSICPTGCEMDYAESGLYVTMLMPDYAANDVSMEEIDAHVGQVLGGTYCAGDVRKGNGIMLFAIDGKHGARMANTLFRPSDCPAQ